MACRNWQSISFSLVRLGITEHDDASSKVELVCIRVFVGNSIDGVGKRLKSDVQPEDLQQ
jgi:hypothetical protein